MNKQEQIVEILADIIDQNGGCGPMGGERPATRSNRLLLTSQGSIETYEVNENGKISLIATDELVEGWSKDLHISPDEIEEWIEEEFTNISVLDLVKGYTDLSFWMYLEVTKYQFEQLEKLCANN